MGVEGVIRDRVLPARWDVPPTSLLCVYIDACKSLGLTAQSGLCKKLFHRSRMTHPWPVHKTHGLGREQLLALILDHATAACSIRGRQEAALRASTVNTLVGLVNPRMRWEDAARAAGVSAASATSPTHQSKAAPSGAAASPTCPPDLEPPSPSKAQPMLPVTSVRMILEAAAVGVSDEELRQAALDVISTYEAPGGPQVPESSQLAAMLVDRLDLQAQGVIDAMELRAVCAQLNPASASSIPWGSLGAEVGREEAVALLVGQVLGGGPKGAMEVYAALNARISPQYGYDLGREYLGPKGLLPLLPVLRADQTFTHLSLSSCGLNCSAVEKLCAALEGHKRLTALDLSRNPIADRGGLALVRLLRANRHLTHLNISRTPLIMPRSRTHHGRLGPSACEDGTPVLSALALNRQLARKGARELVAQLLRHAEDLAAIFYGLSTGHWGSDYGQEEASNHQPLDTKVALSLLAAQLRDVATVAWGYDESALDDVLLHARLIGAGTARAGVDDEGVRAEGTTHISHGEFVAVLAAADRDYAAPRAQRVAAAVRHHRAAVKRAFYALPHAGEPLPPPPAAPAPAAGSSGDQEPQHHQEQPAPAHAVQLIALRTALLQLAVQDLWAVTEEDILWTLTPRTFTEGVPPGVELPVWASGGGVTLTWAAFYGKLMWLLTA